MLVTSLQQNKELYMPFDSTEKHNILIRWKVPTQLLTNTKEKLILSYWGSDLLRSKKRSLLHMGRFVKCADFITFDNKDLEMAFKEIYQWADKMPSETILFGLPVLDIIREKYKDGSAETVREKWRVPEGKMVIAVGYNGIPEQQHIKILNEIEKLEDRYKEKIFLLLQMSYGGTNVYRKQVIAAVKRTNCAYMEIHNFLTNDEVADLRIMTNIYINAQTTDAFSGSVCENLFSESLLINAGWLRYKEFEEYGFKYLEFMDISEIGGLIRKAMDQGLDVSCNKELVWQLRSWECCAPRWENAYRRIIRYNS